MQERTNLNNLTIEAFSSGTTRIYDTDKDLVRAQNVRFSSIYPAGRFLTASMFIPRDIYRFWALVGMQRFLIYNGETVVFEGKLTSGFGEWRETTQGVKLNLTGCWGAVMMNRGINKPWIDIRSSPDVWVWQINDVTHAAVHWFKQERLDGNLHMHAQAGTIPQDAIAGWKYIAPTGQTIKRFTYDYDFLKAGAHQFTMRVWNTADGVFEPNTDINATGSGSHDIELNQGGQGSYTQAIELQMISDKAGGNTITTNTDTHAMWDEITIYTEVDATIDAGVVAADIVSHLSDDINSDVTNIGSPGNEILPFVTGGYEMAASVLSRAAAFGDASNNSWAVGLLPSEDATTPDGKPVLFLEQQPDLDDYEYAIRVDEPNLVPPFSIEHDYYAVYNWIIMKYTDENGWNQELTPDDISTLKDTTSIAEWGQREQPLFIGSGAVTDVVNYGKRYLARYKDPPWTMNLPMKVKGFIRNKGGGITPSSEIVAGKRLQIQNFITSTVFIITKTTYTDKDEICAIQVGKPDFLNPLPAAVFDIPGADPVVGGEDPPVSAEQRWKLIGVSYEKWQEMSPAERRRAGRAAGVRWWT